MFKTKTGTPRVLAGLIKAQKNIRQLKEDLAKQEVTVSRSGVEVTMTCAHVIKRMTLSHDLLMETPELLADLISSAVNAASQEAELYAEKQAGVISALFSGK